MFHFLIYQIMSLLSYVKCSIKILGATLLTSTVLPLLMYWYRTKKRVVLTETVENITEVLFFTDQNSEQMYHHDDFGVSCKCIDCGVQNLKKIIKYLENAKSSVDICVYTITNQKLGNVILKKKREGIKIRVITDASMSLCDGSQILDFRKEGIMVRMRPSQFLMHHKFAVVDKNLLINGSFNWTAQAVYGNWENVMITTVPESLVKSYRNHFEYLWSELDRS